MSNRIYQITALAILIGSPVAVQIVSSLVPVAQQAVGSQAENRRQAIHKEPVETVAVTPEAPPPPSFQQDIQPTADPAMSAEPSLDTQGIAPAGAEFSSDQPPAPSSSAAGSQAGHE